MRISADNRSPSSERAPFVRARATAHLRQNAFMRIGRGVAGRGIFARRQIPKDIILCRLAGNRIGAEKYRALRPGKQQRYSQVGYDEYVGPSGSFDDLFNHSCEPNLSIREFEGELVFMPRRSVRAGEELTWDYASVVTDRFTKFPCRCKSPRCRFRVGRFASLSSKQRRELARDGGAPSYVFHARHERRTFLPQSSKRSWEAHLFIGPTVRTGQGLYTSRAFSRGELVGTLRGPEVRWMPHTPEDVVAFPNWYGIGKGRWIAPLPPFGSLNHSCDPNMGIRGSREFVALRAINAGEELTIDYAITEDERLWSMLCLCGSPICRGQIRSIQSLPKDRYQSYLPYVGPHFRTIFSDDQRIKNLRKWIERKVPYILCDERRHEN